MESGRYEARKRLLEEINTQLAARKLKPITALGDHSQGQLEITGIKEWVETNTRFFTDVVFTIMLPNGDPGQFQVRFNANGLVSDGAVLVVLINGKYALVRQWRLPLGEYTLEVPRGFGETMDNAKVAGRLGGLQIADLPLGTLMRELNEEVMKDATITSVTHLGNMAQNSGTDHICPSFFLIQIKVKDEKNLVKVRSDEMGGQFTNVELLTADDVEAETGGKINDLHSLGALSLARKYIRSLPRAGA